MEDKIKEEKEIAKEWRDICLDEAVHAKKRSNLLSDEFSKNLLQISSIIFGIATAFVVPIIGQLFLIRFIYISGLIALICSLIFGLVNIQIKQNFWESVVATAHRRVKYYSEAREGTLSLDKAKIGAHEATQGKSRIGSPGWAWITQTIFTFLGIISIGISISLAIFK